MATNQRFILSTVFGIADARISKNTDNRYTLHIALTPHGESKIAGYLTQGGHSNKRQAMIAWLNMQSRLELELRTLSLRQHAVNGGDMD